MGLDLAQLLAAKRANRLDAFPRALAFLSRHLAS